MPAHVPSLLDKAKLVHRLPSDYKLALVMGISHSALTSYRAGKTLPDARVIAKICDLTGDDPALVLAEIEEQRATTDDARALWHQIAVRLQRGAAAGVFSVLAVVALAAGFPSGEAHAKTSTQQVNPLYIVECGRRLFLALFLRLSAPAVRILRGLKGSQHDPRAASTAAA